MLSPIFYYKLMAPKLFFSTASTVSFFTQQVLYLGICWLIFLSLRKATPEIDLAISS